MFNLKTITSAVTAAVLVSGIGLAVAQTEDQPATDPKPAMPLASEETPPATPAVDQTAMPAADVNAQQPADDPSRSPPPADPTAPLPAQDPAQTQQTTPAAQPAPDTSTAPAYQSKQPAPRADRN